LEHRLRVFENRVLRKIFGPKGDEVTRNCRGGSVMRNVMMHINHQIFFNLQNIEGC
jgi:hypothetical protein